MLNVNMFQNIFSIIPGPKSGYFSWLTKHGRNVLSEPTKTAWCVRMLNCMWNWYAFYLFVSLLGIHKQHPRDTPSGWRGLHHNPLWSLSVLMLLLVSEPISGALSAVKSRKTGSQHRCNNTNVRFWKMFNPTTGTGNNFKDMVPTLHHWKNSMIFPGLFQSFFKFFLNSFLMSTSNIHVYLGATSCGKPSRMSWDDYPFSGQNFTSLLLKLQPWLTSGDSWHFMRLMASCFLEAK